ncbi:helix-turn-helix domain-containing protein [Parapedobacter sp. ISTM3]|uniref:Transcriptional regulator GlxA family, contains an amidase domain and an AraC-type DNA-binding HTH domain n=1 Tax=Parapedobacter luteus TaxID=623280 RepID=A0A1T5C7E5_9SPHI|nr:MULTISPECIES: helix-turn-helix domain-containing protein [Parapedobacter]MBK1439182.1 helix-turn-helix domain-containing protein [Parapedobacter sp. ISTM3]SKB55327.1 Transcriptional regulator GlxA family, contains an amidase domain and an AraC-type DNA-binding HTH domain [Parapedobacter luteus]
MQLSIILTNKYRLLSLAAIVDVFETANRFLQEDGKPELFNITFVGTTATKVLPDSLSHIAYATIEREQVYDLIFVPAFGPVDMAKTLEENSCLFPWLHAQYQRGAMLASNCTGAFLLAASGLLNDRRATTHVDAADKLATYFPKVKLEQDAVVTHDANIYTSGGATSGFHLMLALIQKCCGREMAVRIAKTFSIDMDRENQAHFSHFAPVETHDDALVMRVQHKIKSQFPEIRSIEEAIADIPASRRNFVRRFKQATGLTPIRYLQKTKIEAAKKLLENTEKGLFEIMLAAGYNDMKNFRQLFKENTGMTPKAYRDKFAMRFEPII